MANSLGFSLYFHSALSTYLVGFYQEILYWIHIFYFFLKSKSILIETKDNNVLEIISLINYLSISSSSHKLKKKSFHKYVNLQKRKIAKYEYFSFLRIFTIISKGKRVTDQFLRFYDF